jgi:hypothetical protein
LSQQISLIENVNTTAFNLKSKCKQNLFARLFPLFSTSFHAPLNFQKAYWVTLNYRFSIDCWWEGSFTPKSSHTNLISFLFDFSLFFSSQKGEMWKNDDSINLRVNFQFCCLRLGKNRAGMRGAKDVCT